MKLKKLKRLFLINSRKTRTLAYGLFLINSHKTRTLAYGLFLINSHKMRTLAYGLFLINSRKTKSLAYGPFLINSHKTKILACSKAIKTRLKIRPMLLTLQSFFVLKAFSALTVKKLQHLILSEALVLTDIVPCHYHTIMRKCTPFKDLACST